MKKKQRQEDDLGGVCRVVDETFGWGDSKGGKSCGLPKRGRGCYFVLMMAIWRFDSALLRTNSLSHLLVFGKDLTNIA